MKKIKLSMLLVLPSIGAFAADVAPVAAASAEPSVGLNSTEMLIVILLVFTVVLLVVSVALLNAFKVLYQEQLNPTPYTPPVKAQLVDYHTWLKKEQAKPSIWTKLLSLRPMEEEKNLIIDHSYDGIKELDNPVPAWFNILFLATVIFAISYLFYYEVSGYGDTQDKEYANEMAQAKIQNTAFLAKSANTIDENTVKLDNAPAIVQEGKSIFATNCAVCHGDKGQGIIGPNLTDDFWLHGGGINNVFKTIKYGVPAKGMISWEKNLDPKKISAVANFILSLHGTNPAGAKAAEGEKYEAKNPADNQMKAASDSVIVKKP
ncbi:cytochrome c oxidase cbb3-type subunit 3 [Pedobacter sp. UYP30]|uniref:cbb3-type cytochrome c oxidase N-terminal domain-containing protein n=1 Tax=Pedobacter sp. UYP30 TaxID=1756400 RepID=UPI00339A768E